MASHTTCHSVNFCFPASLSFPSHAKVFHLAPHSLIFSFSHFPGSFCHLITAFDSHSHAHSRVSLYCLVAKSSTNMFPENSLACWVLVSFNQRRHLKKDQPWGRRESPALLSPLCFRKCLQLDGIPPAVPALARQPLAWATIEECLLCLFCGEDWFPSWDAVPHPPCSSV